MSNNGVPGGEVTRDLPASVTPLAQAASNRRLTVPDRAETRPRKCDRAATPRGVAALVGVCGSAEVT